MTRTLLLGAFLMLLVACDRSQGENADSQELSVQELSWQPGHFGGAFPCVDCSRHRMNLMTWRSGAAMVRDEKLGTTEGDQLNIVWGRWKKEGERLTLSDENGVKYEFRVVDEQNIEWQGDSGSDQPGATNMGRMNGTLTPGTDVGLRGTFYYVQRGVAHFRECQSGKDLLVRLDPQAADIEAAFERAGADSKKGAVVNVNGSLQVVNLQDEDGDVILLVIKSWSDLKTEITCPH